MSYNIIIFILTLSLINIIYCIEHKFEMGDDKWLMDGKPFQIISGSLHYFRVHPYYWEDRILKLKALGLNTISTYVAWNIHEPEKRQYNFKDFGDIEYFLDLCLKHNMYVLLRPGPYICSERDYGGLPYWLLQYKNISIRTYNDIWLNEIKIWYNILMNKINKYLYSNNGIIILVQVENEYGSYYQCNFNYMHWLYNETIKYTGNNIILYTTDGPSSSYLKCGAIEEAYASVDFSPGDCTNPFIEQRKYQKLGPNMNSEYYVGHLAHWGEKFPSEKTDIIIKTMKQMLDLGASFNFYVGHGGTNFGFSAGANGNGNNIKVDTTSYNFDAPINEAGDITLKYISIRNTLIEYVGNLPQIPDNTTKYEYGFIYFNKSNYLFNCLNNLVKYKVNNDLPINFEDLNNSYGYVLYTTNINLNNPNNNILNIDKIRDFILIYINGNLVGKLSRSDSGKDFVIPNYTNNINNNNIIYELKILVESQGRINYGNDMEKENKGIENVKLNNIIITNWTMETLPMDNISNLIYEDKYYNNGPSFYYSELYIDDNTDLYDTFLDVRGWNKGHIYINHFNLGRYFEPGPPQHTLFVPKPLLKKGINEIVVFEQDKPSDSKTMKFIDYHILDY